MPPSTPTSFFSRLLPFLLAGATSLLLTGCASPGQPKPPSLHIPAVATGLHATREGSHVHLTWSTPADSTDGQGLRGALLAALCRDLQPGPHPTSNQSCHRVGSVSVTPGASAADDLLPPALLTGPATLLSYRIQLFNAGGRAAAPSEPAFAPAGAAPPPLGPMRAVPAPGAVLLTWTPSPGSASVDVRRTLISPAPRPGPSRSGPAIPVRSGRSTRTAQPETVTLRVPSDPDHHMPADPGGLRDSSAQPLATYRYIAQRMEAVTLPGPGGPLTLELRGEPSAPITLTFQDVFPPHTPTGLVAFGSPGDPGTPGNPSAIDLSWEPGMESDLQGYNIFRATAATGRFTRLNPAPLPGPAFRDLDVHPGDTFFYRVTAVDRTGNESPPSPVESATVPRP